MSEYLAAEVVGERSLPTPLTSGEICLEHEGGTENTLWSGSVTGIHRRFAWTGVLIRAWTPMGGRTRWTPAVELDGEDLASMLVIMRCQEAGEDLT